MGSGDASGCARTPQEDARSASAIDECVAVGESGRHSSRRAASRSATSSLAKIHTVRAYRDAAYWRYALTVWILAADDVADLDAARRPEWRPLSPTATHSSMADADRASS